MKKAEQEKEQDALQDLTAKDAEVEKKEQEFKEEATDKEQEIRKAINDEKDDFVLETSEGENTGIEQPHVWTYVLVRALTQTETQIPKKLFMISYTIS